MPLYHSSFVPIFNLVGIDELAAVSFNATGGLSEY